MQPKNPTDTIIKKTDPTRPTFHLHIISIDGCHDHRGAFLQATSFIQT